MHIVSRYTAAEAAATIDPRGRAIALSAVSYTHLDVYKRQAARE